jgi:hypothetical protein
MADNNDNFLSRWSRRKVAVKQGAAVAPQASALPDALPTSVRAEPVLRQAQDDRSTAPATGPSTSSGRTEVPPPTLDDVAQLTKESDYTRFIAPDVEPGVKNAAMKKLFASDPHFNVMDGLDTYIDDYNKFEPLTKSMLRQLVSARALGLIDDELEEQPKPDNVDLHENAAVQLQPDDAAGRRLADEGAGPVGPDDDPHDPVPPRST